MKYEYRRITGRGVDARKNHANDPSGQTASLALDVCCFDYRPPLLDLGTLQNHESFGHLLVMRGNFEAQIGQPFLHPWISQGIGDRFIQLVDERLRRGLRRPKSIPERRIESGHSVLVPAWH